MSQRRSSVDADVSVTVEHAISHEQESERRAFTVFFVLWNGRLSKLFGCTLLNPPNSYCGRRAFAGRDTPPTKLTARV